MRALWLPSLLRLWATLLLVGLAGCGFGSSADDEVSAYVGEWHFQYGASPRLPDGSLTWASESPDPDPWEVASGLHNPIPKSPAAASKQGPQTPAAEPTQTEKKARRELWLRTRLQGPSPPDPTLFLHEVDQCMEAYLDGQLLLRFGPMDAPQEGFVAKRPIYLPLGPQYQGRLLTLRFQSSYRNIGIIRPPLLGGRAALLTDAVRRGLPFLIVGMIALVLGLGVLCLYLVQRRERLYLLYALQCLVLGPYLLSRSLLRAYLFDAPALWRYVLVSCFCLVSAAMCAFVAHLFEDRVSRYLRGMSLANLALFVIGLSLTLAGVIHLETFFYASLIFWLPYLISIAVSALLGLVRGNADARILAWGMLLTSVLALPQLLSVLDVFSTRTDVRAVVGLVFLIAMGSILVRRYRLFLKRMADYALVMNMSLEANEHSGSHEHAHRTLKALLRLLEAERAFMFLCRPDGTGVSLLAGRDAQGRISNLSPASTGHDSRVVEAALQKRRPVSRSRYIRRPATSGEADSSPPVAQSLMAAPLLVQGRLLGLLYLEAAPGRQPFGTEDLDVLIELGNQVALTLTATRVDDLEIKSTQTRKRLGEQWSLIQAATRLAAGELQTPIVVDDAQDMAPLARAIESMRRDLLAKLSELESSHSAVQQLNADLRYQLDKRLQRALTHKPESPSSSSLTAPPLDGEAGPGAASEGPSKGPGKGPAGGAQLGRHYRIVASLAEAPGSRLYEVRRDSDRRRFLAKVLTFDPSPSLLARFVREAKILTAVRDPHIAAIVDIDRTADGLMFLITEYPRSTPLHKRADLYGSARPEPALAVISQVLRGLATLHENGIVHRNLQPDNILIVDGNGDGNGNGEPRAKLTDFGVSTALDSAPVALAADLRQLASQTALPRVREEDQPSARGADGRYLWMYRAPELFQGLHHASPKSDVFSLGVIAYELLTGELPLPEPAAELHRRGEPLRIPTLAGRVPRLRPRVASLLLACLSAAPAERPSAPDLLRALQEVTVADSELVTMLAALGDDKARALLSAARQRLRLSTDELAPAQALQILDDLAGQPGLVGVTARSARAGAAALYGPAASNSQKPGA